MEGRVSKQIMMLVSCVNALRDTQVRAVRHLSLFVIRTPACLEVAAHKWGPHSAVSVHWRELEDCVSKVSPQFSLHQEYLCVIVLLFIPTHAYTLTLSLFTALSITIPSFANISYIAYPPLSNATDTLTITLTFNPSSANGLLLFASYSETDFGDFFLVALVDSFVSFRFNLGGGSVAITSADPIEINTWHSVTVSHVGTVGRLYVDDRDMVEQEAPGPFTGLNVHTNLFLGGLESFFNISSLSGTSGGFSGCVSSMSINGREIDLILDAESGYGIGNCNATLCDPNPCFNEGVCTEMGSSFVCECVAGFTGPLCGSTFDPCGQALCAEGSTCIPGIDGISFTCLCPLSRGGDTCEEGESLVHAERTMMNYPPLSFFVQLLPSSSQPLTLHPIFSCPHWQM